MTSNAGKSGGFKVALIIVGIILILASVVSIILFLLHGSTTMSNERMESNIETLSCEGSDLNYPIFGKENLRWDIKINAILKDNILNTISLLLKTRLADEDAVKTTWVQASKAIEERYAQDGLRIDSLNMQFSDLENNILQMTLYAEGNTIKNIVYKYFMLNKLANVSGYTIETIRQLYAEQGLNCVIIR